MTYSNDPDTMFVELAKDQEIVEDNAAIQAQQQKILLDQAITVGAAHGMSLLQAIQDWAMAIRTTESYSRDGCPCPYCDGHCNGETGRG